VNNTTKKTAPQGAIDQLGHLLAGMIHAFVEAKEDKKYSWPNGMLRIDFGEWTVGRGNNGTLHTFSRNHQEVQ
jgi:hypothetical protein